MSMNTADDELLTSDEAGTLRRKAVRATVERDVAVEAAMQAAGEQAVATEDAREQHAVAAGAQSSSIRASQREADAKDAASEQHVAALDAQAEADYMNSLRQAANTRADNEARGNRSRLVYILLIGISMAVLVMVIAWLLANR